MDYVWNTLDDDDDDDDDDDMRLPISQGCICQIFTGGGVRVSTDCDSLSDYSVQTGCLTDTVE